jgi:2-hydroxycyclohexanecarboxyl-CoA dehydrogenase
MEADRRFSGRHVAVTGAGRGIGRSLAGAFARDGADLSIFSRTAADLESLAAGLRSEGARALALPCDVTDRAQVGAAVARAREAFGPVDVLVNSAGVFLWKPFLQSTPEEWDRVIATNLKSAFLLCHAVLPEMVESGRGRIVNIASIHGLHGEANLAAHCAAKFGLIGMTQSLAKEFRRHNVTVNAVCPGSTENRTPAEELGPRKSPLSEKLRPQDIAAAVLWLCSEEGSSITGASIEIYGGTHVRIEP